MSLFFVNTEAELNALNTTLGYSIYIQGVHNNRIIQTGCLQLMSLRNYENILYKVKDIIKEKDVGMKFSRLSFSPTI